VREQDPKHRGVQRVHAIVAAADRATGLRVAAHECVKRVGEHRAGLARHLEELGLRDDGSGDEETLRRLCDVDRVIADALDAFVRGDAQAGRAICRRDDSVDALHASMFRILLTHMMEDPHIIGTAMELFLVSRNLERVADLATNIAEDVVFLVEGKSIKHHAEDIGT
jgi:phosphate transport system protein